MIAHNAEQTIKVNVRSDSIYEKNYEMRNQCKFMKGTISAIIEIFRKIAINMFKTTTFSILWIDIAIQTLSWASQFYCFQDVIALFVLIALRLRIS